MEYVSVQPTSIEVKLERKVTLGNQVNMVPSYGYAGVDTGIAKVVGINHDPRDSSWYAVDGYEGLVNEMDKLMEDFIEVELEMISPTKQSHEYQEHYNALHSEPWVAYKYLRGYGTDGDESIYVFPLSLFISHSVPAI